MKNYFQFFFARLCLLFFTHRYGYKLLQQLKGAFELFTYLSQEA